MFLKLHCNSNLEFSNAHTRITPYIAVLPWTNSSAASETFRHEKTLL